MNIGSCKFLMYQRVTGNFRIVFFFWLILFCIKFNIVLDCRIWCQNCVQNVRYIGQTILRSIVDLVKMKPHSITSLTWYLPFSSAMG